MARSTVIGPAITILSGANVSNIILAKEVYDDAETFILYGPPTAVDGTHVYKIQVSFDDAVTASSTWWQLSNGVDDVTAPRATYAISYPAFMCRAFRIKDVTGNTSGDTVWQMTKTTDAY